MRAPTIAFAAALLTLIAYYLGGYAGAFVPLVLTLAAAIMGLFLGADEHPVSSRVACILAILLGLSPFFAPAVQQFRLQIMEARRAEETRPLYEQMDERVAELKPQVREYYNQYGLMPDKYGGEMLPYMDRQGNLRDRPEMEEFSLPIDPFDQSRELRMASVRQTGVLFVSVGQDGAAEMPLPAVSLDGPPMHRLAPYASQGQDPRLVTYDPTNGALGLGDVVRWHGREDYEEAFEPLFDGWDAAHQASPYDPNDPGPGEQDPNPQSRRDSSAAQALLEDEEYLGALALASRGLQERSQYPAQWKGAERYLNRTRGRALYELGAYREAADALVLYLDVEPNDAYAHYYAGLSLVRGGNRQSALTHLAAASQIDPEANFRHQAQQIYETLRANGQPDLPDPWIVEQEREQGRRQTPERWEIDEEEEEEAADDGEQNAEN